MVKNLPAMQKTRVQSLGQEDPLEKGMATHSSIPACKSPWTEEPGRLQSIASQRVRYDWHFHFHFQKPNAVRFHLSEAPRIVRFGDFPGDPVVRTCVSSAGAWGWSLVRELRCRKLHNAIFLKKKIKGWLPAAEGQEEWEASVYWEQSFHLRRRKSSEDGWWWWLYNHVNLLNATDEMIDFMWYYIFYYNKNINDKKEDSKQQQQKQMTDKESSPEKWNQKLMKIVNNYFAINFLKTYWSNFLYNARL